MPVIAFVILFKSMKSENENSKMKSYFLVLYQGLKPSVFYWEFVNSLRKVLILVAFLLPTAYKVTASTFILIIIWRIQKYIQPYRNDQFNDVEILGINAAIVIILTGIAFNQNDTDTNNFLNFVLLFFILVLNFIFLMKWFILMIENFGEKWEILLKVNF